MGRSATEVSFAELQSRLAARAGLFSTSVVGVTGHEEAEYIGGGTLVTIEGLPGILTAAHLWKGITDDHYAYVAVTGAKSFKAPAIRVADWPVYFLGPPKAGDLFGPDLAFLRLPDDYAIWIGESGKLFYDLAGSRKAAEALAPTAVGEPRLVFAVPCETTSKYLDEDGTGPLTRFQITTHSFTSRISNVHELGGYDYIDFSLEDQQSDDFPSDYHGASGSAIWWVGHELDDGRMVSDPSKIILEGVVLRHGPKKFGSEFLRCHGRGSVYRFYDLVAASPIIR